MRLILGLILVVSGVVWTLQGLDILGGSAMSGVTLWAVVGPLVQVDVEARVPAQDCAEFPDQGFVVLVIVGIRDEDAVRQPAPAVLVCHA